MGEEKIGVSESEYYILKTLSNKKIKEFNIEDGEKILNIDKSKLASILRLLESKKLLEIIETNKKILRLTEKGKKALEEGLPEEKLIKFLKDNKSLDINFVKEKLGEETNIAIGQGKKLKIIDLNDGKVTLKVDFDDAIRKVNSIVDSLKNMSFDKNLEKEFISRGLIKEDYIKEVKVIVREDAINKVELLTSKISHELLAKGLWKDLKLREYDIRSEPPIVYPARKHFFVEFIEELKDIMKELGFKEVQGPLIEIELFNFDILFQPQDHPAREIHDTLWIKDPRYADLNNMKEIINRVSSVHERGWKYKFNPEISSRYVLRSQTTSVSARLLISKPKPPVRFFTIGKVYRSDVIDASHLPEFHQLDGIMGDYDYNFRDLLGILKEFGDRLGIEIKFKPGYFPFTEPSVEGYAKINDKWIELFGAGLFRPEVLEMANIDYKVGAWGMGVERLIMARLGLSDIRLLYETNYDFLRSFKAR
ncbi:phenylalanyl-tRNA synthetase, alpha subunit [Caldisphaera lagunensis DSM 15908]|uniref:phenylalanine--tRNA ligase n=1 Tax=Caldisphaera lagunensis (strain DSM 15908 / JCM 11604 / ANMR 0165 / IC-154) TaxID=1056495 RepID=L0AAD5_CALLD|nr:phenylalanine--tRNA ligase subunit alpha [Caldisphaera lagunensis]AFZ70077.1 phenylalanyl-tRNA synthetase, alpha subunit [Caldisphaera lagunensis DSM 15908]